MRLCRFQQSFGSFTMYHIAESSKTGLVRHLSNHVFRSPYFRKYISYEGQLFFHNVQNLMYISKTRKKIDEKVFCFLDNCVCISCDKLSLLRRGYLSSTVDALADSPKVLHLTKGNFFELNFFPSNY